MSQQTGYSNIDFSYCKPIVYRDYDCAGMYNTSGDNYNCPALFGALIQQPVKICFSTAMSCIGSVTCNLWMPITLCNELNGDYGDVDAKRAGIINSQMMAVQAGFNGCTANDEPGLLTWNNTKTGPNTCAKANGYTGLPLRQIYGNCGSIESHHLNWVKCLNKKLESEWKETIFQAMDSFSSCSSLHAQLEYGWKTNDADGVCCWRIRAVAYRLYNCLNINILVPAVSCGGTYHGDWENNTTVPRGTGVLYRITRSACRNSTYFKDYLSIVSLGDKFGCCGGDIAKDNMDIGVNDTMIDTPTPSNFMCIGSTGITCAVN